MQQSRTRGVAGQVRVHVRDRREISNKIYANNPEYLAQAYCYFDTGWGGRWLGWLWLGLGTLLARRGRSVRHLSGSTAHTISDTSHVTFLTSQPLPTLDSLVSSGLCGDLKLNRPVTERSSRQSSPRHQRNATQGNRTQIDNDLVPTHVRVIINHVFSLPLPTRYG